MEKFKYNTIDEAIAAIKAGQMVLVLSLIHISEPTRPY